MDEKELFYEVDVREHQQWVLERLIACAGELLRRGIVHDKSKLSEDERVWYVEPVWELNTKNIQYGTPEYKEQTKRMGEGWKHHCAHNDHHIEYHIPFSVETLNDPIRDMDLFQIMEMLCDWIGAAKRKGNESSLPLKGIAEEYGLEPQLQQLLRNTLAKIEKL